MQMGGRTINFKENFPSLKGKNTRSWITNSENIKVSYFKSTDIEEYCLDKKKTLDKIFKSSVIEHLTKKQQKELKEILK